MAISTSVSNRFTIPTSFCSPMRLETPENKGFVKDKYKEAGTDLVLEKHFGRKGYDLEGM